MTKTDNLPRRKFIKQTALGMLTLNYPLLLKNIRYDNRY